MIKTYQQLSIRKTGTKTFMLYKVFLRYYYCCFWPYFVFSLSLFTMDDITSFDSSSTRNNHIISLNLFPSTTSNYKQAFSNLNVCTWYPPASLPKTSYTYSSYKRLYTKLLWNFLPRPLLCPHSSLPLYGETLQPTQGHFSSTAI